MALISIGKATSRIKGHQVYNCKYKVGETLICEREPTKKQSQSAITVKNKEVIYLNARMAKLQSKHNYIW